MTRFCTSCGAAIEDGSAFCTGCGAAVEQDASAATCPSCGAPLEDGAAFCTSCGAAVGAAGGASATVRMATPAATPGVPQATMSMPQVGEPAYATAPRAYAGGGVPVSSQRSKKPIILAAVACVAVCAVVAGVLFVADPFGWRADAGQGTQQEASTEDAAGADSTSGTSDGASTGKTLSSKTDSEDDALASSSSSSSSSTSANSTSASTSDAVDHTKGVNAASTGDDYYVLPESSTRVYAASELSGLSAWDLKVARNEIFAKHGRGFNDTALQEYFNSKSWYTRTYSPEDFDAMASPLNETERANIEVIKALEPESNFS